MNSNVTGSIINMEEGELRELVKEVKETMAANVNDKVFSAADLWNIHKTMRTAQSSRRTRYIVA
jgi:hypothetical protein